MRWNEPKVHEKRTIKKFLLFPKTLYCKIGNDEKETRWLEKCEIVQRFNGKKWVDIYWADSYYEKGGIE